MWAEVSKSREAPKQVKRFLDEGAEHFFVWGGDGMAQRCIDTLAGSGATVAIIPAGAATCLPPTSGFPPRSTPPSRTACRAGRARIDVINLNGERFAVMAGTGFDANMIRSADGGLEDKLGRAAYVWTGDRAFAPAVQGQDRGRREPLVERAGELHPGRKHRCAVRGRARIRRRRAG